MYSITVSYVSPQVGGKPSDQKRSTVTQRLDPKSSEKSCVSELPLSTNYSKLYFSNFKFSEASVDSLSMQGHMERPDQHRARDHVHPMQHYCGLHR